MYWRLLTARGHLSFLTHIFSVVSCTLLRFVKGPDTHIHPPMDDTQAEIIWQREQINGEHCSPPCRARLPGKVGTPSKWRILRAGVDKDALNARGEKPLILAAREGHLPVVEALLADGADVNIESDFLGRTAHLCFSRGVQWDRDRSPAPEVGKGLQAQSKARADRGSRQRAPLCRRGDSVGRRCRRQRN